MCASSGQSRFWNVAEPLIRRRDPVRREMDRKAGRLPFLLCLPSFLPPCRPPSLPVNPARGSDGVGRFQGYCRRCMRRRRQAAPSARTEGRSCSRQARAQARAAGPSPSLRPFARSLARCLRVGNVNSSRCSQQHRCSLEFSFFARRRDSVWFANCEGAKRGRGGREEDHISPTNSTGAVLLPTLTLLPSLSFSVLHTVCRRGAQARDKPFLSDARAETLCLCKNGF